MSSRGRHLSGLTRGWRKAGGEGEVQAASEGWRRVSRNRGSSKRWRRAKTCRVCGACGAGNSLVWRSMPRTGAITLCVLSTVHLKRTLPEPGTGAAPSEGRAQGLGLPPPGTTIVKSTRGMWMLLDYFKHVKSQGHVIYNFYTKRLFLFFLPHTHDRDPDLSLH